MMVNSTPSQPAPNLNIANVLTVLRLILVPVFIWFMLSPGVAARWWAFGVFVAASVTDKLDGTLARRLNLVTDFGKLADPIADKALVLSAFVLLSLDRELWWMWIVTILVLVREVGVTLMRLRLARGGYVLPASSGGKLKTVGQMILVIGLLVPWRAITPSAWPGILLVAQVLAVLVVLITVATGLHYALLTSRLRRGASGPGDAE